MSMIPELLSDDATSGIPATMPAQVDPAAVAAAEEAKALVQAAYTMAMHKPRNFMQARQRILDACKRPSFAASVEYAKPVGGQTIKGPSIRFAELAVQQWGNIRVDTTTTFENEEFRKIRVQVLDLETNACFGRVVTVNKTVERSNPKGREVLRQRINTNGNPVYIIRSTEDELATKEAAAISKIVRNEGLRLIPQDIIEEALEVAREARRGNVDDPQEQIRRLCDAFASLRISPDDLTEYLGCTPDKASPSQVDDLRGIYNAIKAGEAKWSDYLQRDEEKAASASTETANRLKNNLAKAKEATANLQPKAESEDSAGKVPCPDRDGRLVDELDCPGCPHRQGCPTWN